jgi:GT2 family glycosyltransferase
VDNLSVVIPTYNRRHSLQRVLEALDRQTLAPEAFEVVVVCDGPSDSTADYLAAAHFRYRLRWFVQANQGPAAARNRGVTEARGELIVFLDDDVVPDPTLLAAHVHAHARHGDQTIVIGPMVLPQDWTLAPWSRWSQERLAEQYSAMARGDWAPTARQFYTGNTSLGRAHLTASGGFDPRFRRAEDVELGYRLAERGLRFVFCPEAVGYHYEERTFAAWLSIPYDYGRSDVVFAREKGQSWLLPTILSEYHQRPWVVRLLASLCLDRPWLRDWMTLSLRQLTWIGGRLNWPLLLRGACSGLFNLYHYQGIADALGGRQYFYERVVQAVT